MTSVIVQMTLETEQRLRLRANQRGETLEVFLRELFENEAASETNALFDRPESRVPGMHSGSMQVATDFDSPLPDEFWTGEK